MAAVLLPNMLQVGRSNQTEVEIADYLLRIAHDALHASCVLYKVKFIHRVVVDRIRELLLVPVGDVEHVLSHQRCNLMNNLSVFCHHVIVINE